jgi:hypothetical protein
MVIGPWVPAVLVMLLFSGRFFWHGYSPVRGWWPMALGVLMLVEYSMRHTSPAILVLGIFLVARGALRLAHFYEPY